MEGRDNQCSRCLIEDCLISNVDDDPRDEIINNTTASQMQDLYNKTKSALLQQYKKKKKEYLSSLTTKKSNQTSNTRKTVPSIMNNNDAQKKWNAKRLTELSKPKIDYYDYTEEIVTTKHRFRQVNFARINDLAIPRRTASNVEQTHKCNHCKVPLSALLPSIERLAVAPKRTDESEHIKTDEDTFSVKKSALKYVATERLKQLAIPRPSYQDVDCLD